MFISLKNADYRTIRQYRLAFGLTLSVAIAFAFNWPLAYFMPLLVCKFLCGDTATLPTKALAGVFVVVLGAFFVGLQYSKFVLPYPFAFFILAGLLIFWLAYWGNSGGNEFVVTLLFISIAVIPLLAKVHAEAATQFTLGFGYSCFIAIIVTLATFSLFPINREQSMSAEQEVSANRSVADNYYLAGLTTLVALPAFIFFFLFDMTGGALILTFIMILAQKPQTILGTKGSVALLVGNILGGVIALLMFALLIAVTDYGFMVLLYGVMALLLSFVIFSSRKVAPLFAIAITTVVVILGSSTLADGGASSTFASRILQIALACLYVLFSSNVAVLLLGFDKAQLQQKIKASAT
ncbi:DUF2955 domain-containing protein [Thalassotalea sp. LPB0316]|uniref:DUF2955 domain-containing protein n=1 Tax=Thalassotalea sp. LPB0316 TaxID=2769490 RepID=UPI0018666F33|nr:DUF2955 domain-containing protein [Thalassotalea sp. LPB0316]QOL26359.1 DUF2955 domain-containing protein [Thalassotalea sp. LPB0316]